MNFVKKQFLTLMFFLTMIIGPANAVSQEYSFEIPEEEESSLQFNGNLDVKWAFLQSRNESPIYRFQFSEYSDMENYLSQYRLDYYFNSEYRNKKLFFRMKTYTQYSKNDPLDIFLYELYGSLNLSPKLSMGIGKKRFIWGKGYAFNPVGYVKSAPLSFPFQKSCTVFLGDQASVRDLGTGPPIICIGTNGKYASFQRDGFRRIVEQIIKHAFKVDGITAHHDMGLKGTLHQIDVLLQLFPDGFSIDLETSLQHIRQVHNLFFSHLVDAQRQLL